MRNLEQWYFPREDLTEEGILGHGKYGKVYIAKARGINEGEIEVVVAVKQLAAENEDARQAFDHELEMLTQLKHPNVIKLLGVCVKDFPLLMITDYSEHVSIVFAMQGLRDKFAGRSSIRNYNTRNNVDLQFPRFNLEYSRNVLSYAGLKAWNGNPAYIRGIDTPTFKSELRKYFLR